MEARRQGGRGAMSLGRIIELGAGCTPAMHAPGAHGRPGLAAGSYSAWLWAGQGKAGGLRPGSNRDVHS